MQTKSGLQGEGRGKRGERQRETTKVRERERLGHKYAIDIVMKDSWRGKISQLLLEKLCVTIIAVVFLLLFSRVISAKFVW